MKIPEFKNVLVRLLYIIPLIIFVVVLVMNLNELDSRFFLYVSLVPILIFAYQSIRNSIIGWIAVMMLYVIYLVIWIIYLIAGYHYIPVKTSYVQYFSWWIPIIIYFGVGFLYIKFKPKKRIF